jgi:hypothetical protein
MLILTPRSGMCNRLLALHSAIRLSADIGQQLQVIWRRETAFPVGLQDVFEEPPEVARWYDFDRLKTRWRGRLREYMLNVKLCPPPGPMLRAREIEALRHAGYDFRLLGRLRNCLVRSWGYFYPGDSGFYPYRPLDHLRQATAKITDRFGHTIGVHIRRTDHTPSIQFSTTQAFIEQMRTALDADPSVDFFVASDDAREVNRLREEFPGKIMSSEPRSLSRLTLDGIESAVIDLYALAATRRILGSYGSTFSRTAGLLGDIEVTEVSNVSNPSYQWEKRRPNIKRLLARLPQP